MSEYTPDTETVREQYTGEQPPHIGTVCEKGREFDRWLAGVKANVLRDAADELESVPDLVTSMYDLGRVNQVAATVADLYDRADRIGEGEL